MSAVVNPFTGKIDFTGSAYFRGVSASEPTSPVEGWTYINSGDDGYYIYYGGTWQLLHTLTGASDSFLLLEDGFIVLLETGDKLVLQ